MRTYIIALCLVLGLALTGCVGGKNTESSIDAPAGASVATSQSDFFYYHFDDVLVPADMKLDTDETFVYGIGHQKSGVMVFSGRVEFLSLTKAMVRNMTNDGWSQRFEFNSPRTLLMFTKPTRIAVVNITDRATTTDLEIWVAPRPEGEGDTLDKPLPMLQSPAPVKSSVAPAAKLQEEPLGE